MVFAVAEEVDWGAVFVLLGGVVPLVVVVVEEGCKERSFSSAVFRLWESSAARRAARPQVQSLQARRLRPGRGRHSVAVGRGLNSLNDGEEGK